MAFDQAIADKICERLSDGETLRAICKTKGFPTPQTVWNWRNENRAFFDAIARARELGHDALAEQCLEIADDASEDYEPNGEGGFRLNSEHVQRSRVKIDTRIRLLSKWDPRRYGERLEHNVDGKLQIEIRDLSREDDK